MNYYEKIIILDPNIDDSVVEEIIGKIKDVITKHDGEIFKVDNWGRRKLAYELNKQQKGNYTLLHFKAPPATIIAIEQLCKITDSVLKFMVIKLVKKKQIEAILPSPVDTSAKSDDTAGDDTETVTEEENQAKEEVTSQEDK